MTAQQSWQILIIQAFSNTAVEGKSSQRKCGLFGIYEYIYRALNQSGIENRPPFGWLRIISIWLKSRGDCASIKRLCIEAIQSMQKPAKGFHPDRHLSELVTLILISIALVPQTANTFKTLTTHQTILHIKPKPTSDIDNLEISLPTSSDYQYAANQFLSQPILYERENGVLGSDWIRSQADSGYSLQLLSSSTREAVFEFCQQHNICNNSAYFSSQIKGKTYYRLIYGAYPTHNAAALAVASLPLNLKQLKPWARQFKQIKSEI
jgi:hypothetical protein